MKRSHPTAVAVLLATGFLSLVPAAPTWAQVDGTADAYYYYCLGRMREMEMDSTGALEYYGRAVERDPNAAYLHLAIANVYNKLNNIQRAIASANRAVQLDSELAGAHRFLANAYFQLGRSDGQAADTGGLLDLAINEFKETIRLEPLDGESRLGLAQLYLMRGQTEEATRQLEQQIQNDPDSSYALYLLAQVKRDQGQAQEAAELLRRSVEAEPRHQRARLSLASLYEELGEFNDAAAVYRQALDFSPRDADLMLQLATALAQAGRMNEAATEFENVLVADPDRAEAFFGLALVRRDLKELDQAQELLDDLLRLEPRHIAGRFALVGVYEDKREYREAIDELNKLLSLPEDSYPLEQRAEFLAHLGFAHQSVEELEEAIRAFEDGLEITKGNARFEAYLVQAHLAAKQPEEAGRICEDALSRHPSDIRLQILQAQVFDENGEQQRGLDLLLGLWRDSPEDDRIAIAVATYLHGADRLAEAEAFLREATERIPDDEDLIFQLGAVLERQGNVEGAADAFTKVLALNPDSAGALNYLGYMLVDRGLRLEESLGYIQQAVALDPYNGAYLDSLGWAYFRLGQLDLAEENLLKAIEQLRTTGVVYDHLGDLYFKKGNREQAIHYWEKALEQEDDELEKDQVAQKIEKARSGQALPE